MNSKNTHLRILNKKLLSPLIAVSLLLIGLGGGTTALSQATTEGPPAVMVITATKIKWVPKVEHGGVVLSVSGPGDEVSSRTFEPGQVPIFRLTDASGDGLYTYELRILPPGDEKASQVDDAQRGLADTGGEQPIVLSGGFSILDGTFVTPRTEEDVLGDAPRSGYVDKAVADEVIYDDLIVDGSLCVGNDCYSGLAFGFDTIVLMENNLRIFFDDTSNTSSFPSNDWRIVINDTTNGGASYFALQDVSGGLTPFTVEAGAKTNSLYVDDDGQVGIGTSGPVFELHIKDGDTPAVRLHQSTSYGWPEQIWDVGGNETSFFIRDGTHAARLPFRIEPEAPTSSLAIKSTGYVGIGTWSPAYPLEVETTGENAQIVAQRTSGATAKLGALTNKTVFGSVTNHPARVIVNDSMVAEFETDGDLSIEGYLHEGSDVNSKESFAPVVGKDVLENLEDVSINTWSFRASDDGARHMGPTAQDFYAAYGLGSDDKHISALDVGGVALAAIKELDKIVEEKNTRIKTLEAQNTRLEARVTALEQASGSASSSGASLLTILPWLLVGVLLGTGVPAVIRLRKQRT